MKRHIFNAIGNYCGTREFQKDEPFESNIWFSLSEEELDRDNYQNGIKKINEKYIKKAVGKQKPYYSFSIKGELLGIYLGRRDFGNNNAGYRIVSVLNSEQDLVNGQVLIRVKQFTNDLLVHKLENARFYLQEYTQQVRPLVSVGENEVKFYTCKAAIKNEGIKTPGVYDCLNGASKQHNGKYWYDYRKYMKGGFYSYDKYSNVQG